MNLREHPRIPLKTKGKERFALEIFAISAHLCEVYEAGEERVTFLEKVILTFLKGGTKISRQLRNEAMKWLALCSIQGGLFCEKDVCFSDNAPADVCACPGDWV